MFAALAVTHHVETLTGWSIKKFVQTTRRYRIIAIRTAGHVLTAEEPLPPELRAVNETVPSARVSFSDSRKATERPTIRRGRV